MNRNRWIAGLLCIFLLFCTGCTRGEHEQTTTTQNNQPSSELFSTRSGEIPTREVPYPTVRIPTSPDDPYAQIIKDMYEQYAQYITAEDIFEDVKYALYDLDEDKNNELLISARCFRWGSNDEFSTLDQEEAIIFDRFFSISNGKAIEIYPVDGHWDVFGDSLGGRDILSNGVIRCYGGTPDHISYAYFCYSNGELRLLKSLRYYADESRYLVTYEGDQSTRTPITEAEFNRMRAEIEGDAQVVEIDWKPLESYGRV